MHHLRLGACQGGFVFGFGVEDGDRLTRSHAIALLDEQLGDDDRWPRRSGDQLDAVLGLDTSQRRDDRRLRRPSRPPPPHCLRRQPVGLAARLLQRSSAVTAAPPAARTVPLRLRGAWPSPPSPAVRVWRRGTRRRPRRRRRGRTGAPAAAGAAGRRRMPAPASHRAQAPRASRKPTSAIRSRAFHSNRPTSPTGGVDVQVDLVLEALRQRPARRQHRAVENAEDRRRARAAPRTAGSRTQQAQRWRCEG